MRILLVEDEKRLSDTLKKGLIEEGFAVDQAFDGQEALYLVESEDYDLILLDIMLPKVDGITVCRELRKKKIETPVLMLTAKSNTDDKVQGLDAGADDYLSKPFEFIELKSRIHALIRRSHHQHDPILRIADLEVDPLKHTVIRAGEPLNLTPKEFSTLEFLMRHINEVVTRTQIIEHVWDYNFDSMSNVIDVFIATLRRKLDKNHKLKLIHTVHGVGYKISEKYD